MGASFDLLTPFKVGLSYGQAYMEARLDYMKHGKFTRLEEEVGKIPDYIEVKS